MELSFKEEMPVKPVFIHSSFRVGSTWLWSKFRNNPSCYCYYEIFNEALEEIDFQNISHSSFDWNSGHPSGPPYFSEFAPLLKEDKGVEGFERDMSFKEFFAQSNCDDIILQKYKKYLSSIVMIGSQNQRIPILSCTRSVGRLDMIKDIVGGTHIFIKRNLLNQWFSYSNQAYYDNFYFLDSIIKTVNSENNYGIIKIIKKLIDDNDLESYKTVSSKLDMLLVCFLSLHLFLYSISNGKFDVEIEFDKKTTVDEIDNISSKLKRLLSIDIDLSDYKETISAPIRLIDDIDRVILMVRSVLAKGIPGVEDAWLSAFVDRELSKFRDEYERYVAIAGSAHIQLARYCTKQEAASLELAALHQSAAEQIGALQAQVAEISDRYEIEHQELTQMQSALDEKSRLIDALRQAEDANAQGLDALRQQLATIQADEVALRQVLEQASENERQLALQLADAASQIDMGKQALLDEQSMLKEKDQLIDALRQADDANAQGLDALRQQLATIQADEVALRQVLEQASENERQLALQLADAASQLALEKQAHIDTQSVFDEKERLVDALQQQLAASQAEEIAIQQALEQVLEQERQAQARLIEARNELAAEKQATQEERKRAENAVARLSYVLSGAAAEDDMFDRRWTAMIQKLS